MSDRADIVREALRPFFGFYGGKWRDAPKHYPAPLHDSIVEPFAGSAGYSVRYPTRNVILGERDPVIYGVWDYLIHVPAREIIPAPMRATPKNRSSVSDA